MSKGSAPRRKQNYDAYSENYDRIFGGENLKRKRAFEEKSKLSESYESYNTDYDFEESEELSD